MSSENGLSWRKRLISVVGHHGRANAQDHIPSMRQMAFDHTSIPAMNAETERVFSDTKLFISDLRSRLGPEIIEALECIRKWILAGL